jgi:hypothetical protein
MKQRARTKSRNIIISRLGSQEIANSLDKSVCLFQMRTMTAFGETNPFDLAWDFTEERLHGDILSFIVVAVNEQCWDVDLVKFGCDVPILERTDDIEL